MPTTSILDVRDLRVTYGSRTHASAVHAVSGVSFSLRAGEILGVLGESGSGKSTLAAALLRLLPPTGEITSGSITFDGQDLLRAEPRELRKIRGARVSIIYQEPSLALHPTMRIGDQISEVLGAHEPLDAAALRARTLEILRSIFSFDVERISSSYPHQLSGGQRQRALIAQAIACRPAIVIADEPTASLDPTTQQEILVLFQKLRAEVGLALILITHNPALLANFADRVLVMYAGRAAELGSAADVLFSPQHPYTKALLRCLPGIAGDAAIRAQPHIHPRKSLLPTIPGAAPNLAILSQGCAFEPRCADRMDVCRVHEPSSVAVSRDHGAACLKLTSS